MNMKLDFSYEGLAAPIDIIWHTIFMYKCLYKIKKGTSFCEILSNDTVRILDKDGRHILNLTAREIMKFIGECRTTKDINNRAQF